MSSMDMERTLVMDAVTVERKIQRIAHEIFENNFGESCINFMGIEKRGFALAEQIATLYEGISGQEVKIWSVPILKRNPMQSFQIEGLPDGGLKDKVVVLVDDVLNSGRTLIYAAKHILNEEVRCLQTVCLVDRKHRKYPIRADYVGMTLGTTLQEHIAVEFDDEIKVYLD
jgi:pyrimidine operon attenuation protein/uracil phosphoribosyltransferase